MAQINSITNSLTGNKSVGNAINDLDVDDFLALMIAELQNQDPLNPMENDQMLAQIGQMREIAASESLTQTLDSVLLGQNIASSTNLIGAEIDAISNDNQLVSGKVKRVSIAEGVPKLLLEEDAGASVSDNKGALAAGDYHYKIVWEGDDGTLLGIQTKDAISVDTANKSVLLANLPETSKAKQIYRTKVGGEGQFYLVGALNNGKTASFNDMMADEELSSAVLNRTPVYVLNATRKYEVNLNNVGEIRPPVVPPASTTPPGTTPPADDTTEDTDEA